MKIRRNIIIFTLMLFTSMPLRATLDSRADILSSRADSLLQAGMYQEAIEMGLEAEEAAAEADDGSALIKSWCVLGEAHLALGETDVAKGYYSRCVSNPDTGIDITAICHTMLHVAEAFHNIGDYESAESYCLLSLEMCEGLQDRAGNTALRYLELALIYIDTRRFDEAVEALENGLSIIRNSSNHVIPARLLIGYGDCMNKQDRPDEAMAYYLEALEELGQLKSGGGRFVAACNYRIAKYYQSRGEDDKANDYYLKALGHKNWTQDHETLLGLCRDYSDFLATRDSSLSQVYAARADSLSYVEPLNDFGSRMAINSVHAIVKEREKIILSQNKEIVHQQKHLLARLLMLLALAFLLFIAVIINRQRKLANAELKRKDYVNNRMFAVISHDLRAPAIARRSALHLLADSPSFLSNEDIHKLCANMAAQSDSEVVMLENLLQWAKFQSSNPDSMAVVRFDVVDAIQDAVSQVCQFADPKSVSILPNLGDKSLFLCSNRNMLIVVVRNLLVNAVKFSYRGSSVTIELSELDDGALITVTDEGIGMSQAQVDEINSNNTMGKHSRGTENESGSGIGLSLCQDMLHMCDGSLRVESEEGKGSRFSVTIKNKCPNEYFCSNS